MSWKTNLINIIICFINNSVNILKFKNVSLHFRMPTSIFKLIAGFINEARDTYYLISNVEQYIFFNQYTFDSNEILHFKINTIV